MLAVAHWLCPGAEVSLGMDFDGPLSKLDVLLVVDVLLIFKLVIPYSFIIFVLLLLLKLVVLLDCVLWRIFSQFLDEMMRCVFQEDFVLNFD